MAKVSQIDRAIESLKEKREAILAAAKTEAAALEHAIQALVASRVKAKVNRPRPVAPAVAEKSA